MMGQQGCDLRTYGQDTFPQTAFFMFRFFGNLYHQFAILSKAQKIKAARRMR